MIAHFKRFFYFPVASYFRFFAHLRLRVWNPRIILVTGSSGKTTLLHMLDAQIGDIACYSHKANSSFGIPFDILGLKRDSLFKSEWIGLFLKAPFVAFKKPPKEKIYVVEADCDRPGEGKFLAEFLNPEVVLWVSISKSHPVNFEHLVREEKFDHVEEAIAFEFGYFLEYASKLAIINGDSYLMLRQINRTKAKVELLEKSKNLKNYKVDKNGTEFSIDRNKYSFQALLPEDVFYSIAMCEKVCKYLGLKFDVTFSEFSKPPGRGSIFKGIKNTTIIDSSYNANLLSMQAILEMFDNISSEKKWVVIGDMLELGEAEREEHEKLAEILDNYKFEKIILMGKRVNEYTYPKLSKKLKIKSQKFKEPKPALDYLSENITGGEVILFKGARFMEGIIEHMLVNKDDIKLLARREKVWDIRRKQWGL